MAKAKKAVKKKATSSPKKAPPKKAKARARDEKTRRSSRIFELKYVWRPLEHLADTSASEREQMSACFGGISPEEAALLDAWHPLALGHVFIGGRTKYQLYLHPAGAHLFDHETTVVAASATKPLATSRYEWVRPPADPALHGVLEAIVEQVRNQPKYYVKPVASTASVTVAAIPVATSSEQAIANARAKIPAGHGLRFVNYRRPLEQTNLLSPIGRAQLEALLRQERLGSIDEAADNEDVNPLELVDVIDEASGEVRYQLYLWPYGSGLIYEHDRTKSIAGIAQHYWDQRPLDEELRTKFAAAWNEAKAIGIQQQVLWK